MLGDRQQLLSKETERVYFPKQKKKKGGDCTPEKQRKYRAGKTEGTA